MNTEILYDRIAKELVQRANKTKARNDALYHKHKNYISLGVSSPDFKLLMKAYKKQFQELGVKEALDLAQLFYRSDIEDEVYVGNFITALHAKSISASRIAFFDDALDHFHTWGTIDDFCVHTLAVLLNRFPQQTIRLLRKWNCSKNLWKRRASVVVFTRKIGESGRFTDEAIQLCNTLVGDTEDLVRKGVGWALKDAMRGNKQKVLPYVKELRVRGVPAVITLYALRDIKGSERKQILNTRDNS